jgi:UDP-N-acetylmuramoyl-L-alanyl-D-glutamate--2,6-diaminopimelate ligase
MKALSDLIEQLLAKHIIAAPIKASHILLKGITAQSKNIKPGYLFIAKKGALKDSLDGHSFIDDAINRGASALIVDEDAGLSAQASKIPVIRAKDSSLAYAHACELFYGEPSKKLTLIGITGTNGKSSSTFMLHSIFKAAGFKAKIMGTLGLGEPGDLKPLSHTTMEAEFLSATLADLSQHGVSHVIMEVSSHALEQKRVHGLNFTAVACTNISHDHLDFHGSLENYRNAKARLFFELAKESCIKVLPYKDFFGERTRKLKNLIFYQDDAPKDLSVPLLGSFHQENAQLCYSIARGLKLTPDIILEGLKNAPQIPGRLEAVFPAKRRVFIDFAHTSDALERVLLTLKSLPHRKLIVVFGCGGDRDREKRPLMGKIAARLADIVIVTDDNPRSEDPKSIRSAIISDVNKQNKILEIADRKEAIFYALAQAHQDDIVLIAGKGHENYQIFHDKIIDFSDYNTALEALRIYD